VLREYPTFFRVIDLRTSEFSLARQLNSVHNDRSTETDRALSHVRSKGKEQPGRGAEAGGAVSQSRNMAVFEAKLVFPSRSVGSPMGDRLTQDSN
jgi:hypothetical protein